MGCSGLPIGPCVLLLCTSYGGGHGRSTCARVPRRRSSCEDLTWLGKIVPNSHPSTLLGVASVLGAVYVDDGTVITQSQERTTNSLCDMSALRLTSRERCATRLLTLAPSLLVLPPGSSLVPLLSGRGVSFWAIRGLQQRAGRTVQPMQLANYRKLWLGAFSDLEHTCAFCRGREQPEYFCYLLA